MQDKRKITKATIAVAATLLFLLCCVGCSVPVGSQVGQKATNFTLSAVGSNKINLRDLEGKPVLLTFWTTGCGACIYQMPLLEAAHNKLGNEVEFITIDIMENSYTVKQCTDYYGFNLSVALDSDGTVSKAYNIMYTPTNIVINSKGIIQDIKIGAFTDTEQILTTFSDIK